MPLAWSSQLITKLKKHIHNNTIIGDFNTTLTAMGISSKQNINKETRALNDTLDQMNVTDIYRAFHLKATEYTFWNILQKRSHIGSQIRFQPVSKDWDYTLHIFRPQCFKT